MFRLVLHDYSTTPIDLLLLLLPCSYLIPKPSALPTLIYGGSGDGTNHKVLHKLLHKSKPRGTRSSWNNPKSARYMEQLEGELNERIEMEKV